MSVGLVMFHSLCHRVSEPQLFYMYANAAVLLHFIQMTQTCP